MDMPFGKHKGSDIRDVPAHYLQWLEEQEWAHEQFAELMAEVQFEIQRRLGDRPGMGRVIREGK